MTREEAIKVLEKQFDKSCGNYRYQNAEKLDFEDALWMAISALRQQKTVTNRNEPLTLDELRKMDGEPVWVQSPGVPEYGRWAIVEGVGENCLFLRDDFTCHDYGKTWLAYRQKPEECTV